MNEKTNLESCFIYRVKNGWVLSENNGGMAYKEDRWVFTSAATLAKFIADNFALPKKDGAQ